MIYRRKKLQAKTKNPEVNFRPFSEPDAEVCFRIRSEAFIRKFYGELSAEAVAACVNAFMPRHYVAMSRRDTFLMVQSNEQIAGFFTLRRHDTKTAEIPLIYIDLSQVGKGIGRACILHAETLLREDCPEVETLFVDTVIPEYNGGFYEAMGFVQAAERMCDFQGMQVKAVRMTKKLAP